jgi:hypothetical protein
VHLVGFIIRTTHNYQHAFNYTSYRFNTADVLGFCGHYYVRLNAADTAGFPLQQEQRRAQG